MEGKGVDGENGGDGENARDGGETEDGGLSGRMCIEAWNGKYGGEGSV